MLSIEFVPFPLEGKVVLAMGGRSVQLTLWAISAGSASITLKQSILLIYLAELKADLVGVYNNFPDGVWIVSLQSSSNESLLSIATSDMVIHVVRVKWHSGPLKRCSPIP